MLRTARAALDAFHSSLLTSLTFGLASIVLTEPVAAKPLAAWVELIGPNGEASIRAIVSQKSPCPALQSGNDSLQMRVRAEPGPSTLAKKAAEFPVRVCEVKAPKGKTSVLLSWATRAAGSIRTGPRTATIPTNGLIGMWQTGPLRLIRIW